MAKRVKKYNPKKTIQRDEHINNDYIIFAVDTLAMGVLDKKGNIVTFNDKTYNALQYGITNRNACIGVVYKDADGNTLFEQQEISISRCTGTEAMKPINEMTKATCQEVGIGNVIARYYFITGDMDYEWEESFIYSIFERAGVFDLLCTNKEWVKTELEDMRKHMEQYKAKYNSKKSQVGGSHYSDMQVQPIEIIRGLRLNWHLANAYKYLSRHKNKNKYQDLAKAYDYILRELCEGYDNFYCGRGSLGEDILTAYHKQFDKRTADCLRLIENVHKRQWRKSSDVAKAKWETDITELLLTINILCKEQYGVAAF